MSDELEPYIHRLSHFFFVRGMDPEDLAQEARLAAWRARPGLERIAARRRILDLIKQSQRQPVFARLVDRHEAPVSDVVELVAARERLRRMTAVQLTELEREALRRSVNGESVTDSKSIDGALWRARRKLRAA